MRHTSIHLRLCTIDAHQRENNLKHAKRSEYNDVARSNGGAQTKMQPYLPEEDLCMIEGSDAVPQSPGFPMSTPHLWPHQAGDRSLAARLHSHASDSSLGPACESGCCNWRGPLRASILVCRALRERAARHQPLTLICPIILCSTVGAGKTACLWFVCF